MSEDTTAKMEAAIEFNDRRERLPTLTETEFVQGWIERAVAAESRVRELRAIEARAREVVDRHSSHWYEQDAMTETCVCQRRYPCEEGRTARFILGKSE